MKSGLKAVNILVKTIVFAIWLNPVVVFSQNYNELLLDGAWSNNIDKVKNALLNEADVNTRSNDGATPLLYACSNNNLDMVRILVSAGADVNKADNNLMAPLLVSASTGNDSIGEFLIFNGAKTDVCDNYGRTPLLIAAGNGYYVFVDMLLFYKCSLSDKSNDSSGVCHYAVVSGNPFVLQRVVDEGANVNDCGVSGNTPLFLAVINNDTACIRILLKAGAEVHPSCRNAYSPDILKVAVDNGSSDAAAFLLTFPDIKKGKSLAGLRDKVIKNDNREMRLIFRRDTIPMSFRPVFQGLQICPDFIFNFRDHFAGILLETMEMKTKIGLGFGLAGRMWNKNVLEPNPLGFFMQLKERRSVLWFRQYKSIRFFQKHYSGLQLDLGFEEMYSWGRFEGVSFDTWQGWQIVPMAGFKWFSRGWSVGIDGRVYDFNNNLPGFYFSVSGGWIIPFNK